VLTQYLIMTDRWMDWRTAKICYAYHCMVKSNV